MDPAALERTAYSKFKELLDLDPAEQRAEVEALDDPALQVRLRELLFATRSTVFETVDARPMIAADLDENESVPIPLRIGPYDVVRRAGSGATAIVYEAIETIPYRRVAIKVFRTEFSDTLLVNEVQALAERVHPFIPLVLQVGDHASVPWIAMEWVDGAPIGDQHKSQAMDLVAQICDAVHAAHEQGLLHRDLKPSNILVRPDGRPMVLDFGLWRSVGAVGTPPYRAPEVEAGEPADRRSDVYALGVLLRELEGPQDVIARAAAQDPADRFPSAKAMAAALKRSITQAISLPSQEVLVHVPQPRYGVAVVGVILTVFLLLVIQTLTPFVLRLPIAE